MKSSKLSIKFRITFWYTLVFSLILALVFFYIYFLSKSYSVHDLQEELKDESADILENLYDKSSRNDILYNADWTKFYDDNVSISLYDKNSSFINGVLPEHFPDKVPFINNKVRQIKSDKNIWLVYDYCYEESPEDSIWVRSIASYGHWSRILYNMLWIFAVLFPITIFISAFVGYHILKKALQPIYTISDMAKEISFSVNLSKRIETSNTHDEFSYLADAFNSMIAKLEKSFEKEKQFTSDAAHELRTPISVIQSHCEYCLDELKLTDSVREEIEIIYKKTTYIGQLISQLLTISRTDKHSFKPQKEEVDLTLLIESVIEELQQKAAYKNISLLFEYIPQNESYIIQGDTMLLMRMIYNLIENAINYGINGGCVWVNLIKNQENTDIIIKDNGIGIEKEHLDKIWNRFYRVDKSRSAGEGFGLGLSMVRFIVDIHDGSIAVKSKPGYGTTFTVSL